MLPQQVVFILRACVKLEDMLREQKEFFKYPAEITEDFENDGAILANCVVGSSDVYSRRPQIVLQYTKTTYIAALRRLCKQIEPVQILVLHGRRLYSTLQKVGTIFADWHQTVGCWI